MDILTFLHTLFLLVRDHAPWLLWGAALFLGTCLWLALLALVNTAWRLCTSQDERDWFRFLREAKRDHRRKAWEKARAAWRTDVWHKGDGPIIVGLVCLAVIVMVLCR